MASITKLPSGKWRALVRKVGTKALSSTFEKKRDAELWAKNQEIRLESITAHGNAKPPKGTTFADFIEKYIEETDPVKPHGKNKAACLKRLKVDFKNIAMSDMTELQISNFVSQRIKESKKNKKILSGVTISIDLSYISTVLKWAKHVKLYDVDEFAAKKVRGSLEHRGLNTRSNSREREATKEELEVIMAAYAKKGGKQVIPMPDLIRFAIHSAMRQEEICTIKIEDLNIIDRTVVIRNRKDPKNKVGNDQLVPVFDEAWDIVMRYVGSRTSGRIFPFNHRSVSASFTRICKECKIEDLRFHDLRHTATGILFQLGLQIQEVAIVTGHKDWKMLKRYTHIKAKDVQSRHREQKEQRNRRESVIEFLEDTSFVDS